MAALRRITASVLQQLKNLLADEAVPVHPIAVAYDDYGVRNEASDGKRPLRFQWARGNQTEPLFFDFYTWDTAESRKYPDTFLALGTNANPRIVGFPLYLLPQDKECVYLSFKLGNKEGGKNRWFGRGRSSKELRSVEQTNQLAIAIRQALQEAFPSPLFSHPTLSGAWLSLARIPLADLKEPTAPARRTALKTLVFEKLLQAFVIAEKLRDKSLQAVETLAHDEKPAEANPPLSMTTFPLNQILYGPPGTGKTHHTKARAVGIIEGLTDDEVADAYDRGEIRTRFEEYRKSGQIAFVTFHQAFGYEDFVEGIKPLKPDDSGPIQYGVEAGTFKLICIKAVANTLQQSNMPDSGKRDASYLPINSDFDSLYKSFIDYLKNKESSNGKSAIKLNQGGKIVSLVGIDDKDSTLYFRYSGGGNVNQKDHSVSEHHIKSMYEAYNSPAEIKNLKGDSNKKKVNIGSGPVRLLKHVFEELKNFESATAITRHSDIRYTRLADKISEKGKLLRFVLIIDEINRGNVANIFGELITLLEDDKRAGRPEALTVQLPYSKDDFTVPDNLYLLGTMNTADRSVEALDTALRRRFSFTEMLPEPRVIREQVGDNGVVAGVDVARLLEVLNSRLEQLLDRDHCLGHALLLRVADLDGLRAAFQRNILPLLQEYFFGDWGKIGLVLGERFVTTADQTATRHPLAKFGGYDGSGPRERPLYRLTAPASWDATAFQSIYALA